MASRRALPGRDIAAQMARYSAVVEGGGNVQSLEMSGMHFAPHDVARGAAMVSTTGSTPTARPVLFSYSDRAAQEALGLLERTTDAGCRSSRFER